MKLINKNNFKCSVDNKTRFCSKISKMISVNLEILMTENRS